MEKYNFCIDLNIEGLSEEEATQFAKNIVDIANERMKPFVSCKLRIDEGEESEEELMERALELWSILRSDDIKNFN